MAAMEDSTPLHPRESLNIESSRSSNAGAVTPQVSTGIASEDDNGPMVRHNLTPFQLHAAFTSLAVAGFLAALDGNIVGTSMPTIASSFHSLNQQSWIATSYLLTSTALQPMYGRAAELFGAKVVLLTAIMIFEFGSLMVATAHNFIWLCSSRGVAGIGGAGLQIVILIIISQLVPLRERGHYMGVMYARFAFASVIGPVLGGTFTQDVSWRWAFYINLPIGGVALFLIVLLFRKIPNRKQANVSMRDIDFGGAILLFVSITALLLALSWGGVTYPWDSPLVIALLVVGFLLLGCFIAYEQWLAPAPIIPFKIFRHRNVVTSTINYFFTSTGLFGLTNYVPSYFQLVKGDNQLVSGLELLPYVLPLVGSTTAVGFLISRTGWVRPWFWAGGAINLLATGLLIFMDGSLAKAPTFVFLALAGIGMGFILQSNTLAAQSQAGPGELVAITTVASWSKSLGGIVGISIQGSIVQNVLAKLVRENPISAPYIASIGSVQEIDSVPPEVQAIIYNAYGRAFQAMFAATTGLVAVGFIASLFAVKVVLDKDDSSLAAAELKESVGAHAEKEAGQSVA